MNKASRMMKTVDILRLKRTYAIKDLARDMHVSEMTIRRDLKALEQESIVRIMPGGAVLNEDKAVADQTYNIKNAEEKHSLEKMKIARKAAELVEQNDTIILDIGSTTECIPKFLDTKTPITVLTSALNVMADLYDRSGYALLFAGGFFHRETLMCESSDSLSLIKRVRANVAFISAAGINCTLGVTCANVYEVETKQAFMRSATKKVLLFDSSKFGKVTTAYFANLPDFDVVISDDGLASQYAANIRDLGIELIIV